MKPLPRRVVHGATAATVLAGTLLASHAGAYARPGVTTRVDIGPNGEQAMVQPTNPNCRPADCLTASVISGNGRYVAFVSSASNIVAQDRDLGPDVFVRDLKTGVTTMASVSSSGRQQSWVNPITAAIDNVAISADGRYVAFNSAATTLVTGDTNLATDVFVHDMRTGTTTRVDESSAGKQAGQGTVTGLSMSADGRYVAFASVSPDLVSGDTNGAMDVFVRDLKTSTTQRVSLSPSGVQGDGDSGNGFSISPTGRWVVFSSDATNLAPNDTNAQRDVFLRDLTKHVTEPISVRPDGSEVPILVGNSDVPYGQGSTITADGRYVVFSSNSMLLVPNDTNRQNNDWFVRDRATHRTQRISVASDGTDRPIASTANASITPNGRFVVFRTAENLVPEDQGVCSSSLGSTDTDNDIYVHDMRTGAVDLISRSSRGAHAYAAPTDVTAGCQDSAYPSISDDGRWVAFASNATNLVAGDTNQQYDVFLRDRGRDLAVDGFGASAQSASGPAPAPSTCVQDQCVPLCVEGVCPPAVDASLTGARIVVRPALADLFVTVQVAALSPTAAPLYGVDFAASGARYELRMQRQPSAPGSGDFELFRQAPGGGWSYVATVRGGYGTTGEEVVAAIPLAPIGLASGGELTDAKAFSAVGSVLTGAVRLLAELPLRGAAHV